MDFSVAKRQLEQTFSAFLASPTEEAFSEIYQAALSYGPAFSDAQRKGLITSSEPKKVIANYTCDRCKTPAQIS